MPLPPAIRLRPIVPDDMGFLCHLYGTTRQEELALVNWSDEQKAAFVQMQFDAQHSYYQEHYQNTDFLVVLLDEQPIGRLYLARWSQEFRIVDIALLPTHRGRGIGAALMREIVAESDAAGLPVRIHVERYNPALALYERLGFRLLEDKGVYLFLERAPQPATEIADAG